MKKKLIFFLLLFLIAEFSPAFSQVDYNLIRISISDSNNNYFYPELRNRFQQGDTSLVSEDLHYFYYGSVFNPLFDYEALRDTERKIKDLSYYRNYQAAILLADSLLEAYPASLTAHFEKGFAHHALGWREEFPSARKYHALLRTIIKSGDGKSFDTAIHVINPGDIEDALKFLALKPKTEKILNYNGKSFFIYTLAGNKLKLKEIYFDVTEAEKAKERKNLEKLRKGN